MPIAAGENECGRNSMRPFIDRHALDVYQIDLARNGFTDAAYIRARVEEIGARLCNHCYTTPITVAASVHWLSTCRDAFLFEDCVEDSPLRHELTNEKVQAVDGRIRVPDAPGLSVTLNEALTNAVGSLIWPLVFAGAAVRRVATRLRLARELRQAVSWLQLRQGI